MSRIFRARARPVSRRRQDAAGDWLVDVRGQTCPGYLLEINRHVTAIGAGRTIRLLVSYPPCGEDVRAWCAEKGFAFRGVENAGNHYEIVVET